METYTIFRFGDLAISQSRCPAEHQSEDSPQRRRGRGDKRTFARFCDLRSSPSRFRPMVVLKIHRRGAEDAENNGDVEILRFGDLAISQSRCPADCSTWNINALCALGVLRLIFSLSVGLFSNTEFTEDLL